ncbi:hypothetical protein EV421DRAFT_1850013 [Armillaria borealis]|uniref:Uncharacterized protein n=1 Tax=Armillaria borealis TaxID=47425 RepID=A0AA39IXG1_9AGAR|nr:hypothetical protein EV421DRAFT_1850013 [Armillaria borealis]
MIQKSLHTFDSWGGYSFCSIPLFWAFPFSQVAYNHKGNPGLLTGIEPKVGRVFLSFQAGIITARAPVLLWLLPNRMHIRRYSWRPLCQPRLYESLTHLKSLHVVN